METPTVVKIMPLDVLSDQWEPVTGRKTVLSLTSLRVFVVGADGKETDLGEIDDFVIHDDFTGEAHLSTAGHELAERVLRGRVGHVDHGKTPLTAAIALITALPADRAFGAEQARHIETTMIHDRLTGLYEGRSEFKYATIPTCDELAPRKAKSGKNKATRRFDLPPRRL